MLQELVINHLLIDKSVLIICLFILFSLEDK